MAKADILIVEDHATMRGSVRMLLEPEGFEIREASDGGMALEMARERPPDLMLLDLNLPGTDGRDLLAAIKIDTRLQSIPIVVVTTSHNPNDVEWCYRHGANAYQVKAVDYTQFRDDMRLLVEYWLRVCLLPRSAAGNSAPPAGTGAY